MKRFSIDGANDMGCGIQFDTPAIKKYINNNLYYIAFGIYCTAYWLSFTTFKPGVLATVAYLISLLLLAVRLYSQEYTKAQLAKIAAISLIVLISWLTSDDKSMVMLLGFIVAGRGVDFRRLARTTLVCVSLVMVVTVSSCLLGQIGSVNEVRTNGALRMSLGFTHPNRLGAALLSLVVSCAVLLHMKRAWLLALLASATVALNVLICDSRSSVLGTMICCLVFWLARPSRGETRRTQILQTMTYYIIIIIITMSVISMLCYDAGNVVMRTINNALSGRWELAYFTFHQYPPTLFGQSFENASVFLNSFQEVLVDNAYARAILVFGWVPGCLFLAAFIHMFQHSKRQEALPVWFLPALVYAVYGVTESQTLHFAVNYSLIGMTSLIFKNGQSGSAMNGEQVVNKLRNKLLNALSMSTRKVSYKRRLRQVETYLQSDRGLESNGEEITVSLTSYGSRLSSVYLAIASIMDQSIQPTRVVLYLDNETSPEELPERLVSLCGRGLILRRGVDNLRGHKKYYYAMNEYPNSIIITIDDDILYPRDTLSQLIRMSKKYPGSIAARRVHLVTFCEDGGIKPYTQWVYEYRGLKKTSSRMFFTGCGGVLYPPSCMDRTVLDKEGILGCALSADDVWLNCAARALGIRIVRTPTRINQFWELEGTQSEALNQENVAGGGNDIALGKTMDKFKISEKYFTDKAAS